MKIEQSDISFFSSHKKYHEIKEQESLNIWDSEEDAPERLRREDRVELSNKLQKIEEKPFDIPLDSKLMSIIRALEALTGKKINLSLFRQEKPREMEAPKQTQDTANEPERLGWGIEYSYNRTEIRQESMQFSANGSVSSENGTQIEFKLALSMQNSSITHESISFKAGDALIDPLVVNFGTDTVTMSNVKHNFDLNLDGKENEFSFVGSGSGFLALDKNEDGVINDGSELFGPTLGNGFEELSAYDKDNNMWIDENDAIFEKLLIWTKDEDGNKELYSLKDKGIGALYLDKVSTSFDLGAAKLRESSIYLSENGGVGTVQEVDLRV